MDFINIDEVQSSLTKDYLGKSINGYFDEIIKNDTVYQENIDGIERTFNNYSIEELSNDTIQKQPFYSNSFQSLIDNEAENRYEKVFYNMVESAKRNEDLDSLDAFLADFENTIYELDNVKTIRTFNDAGILTRDNGFEVTLNNGHKYQISIIEVN